MQTNDQKFTFAVVKPVKGQPGTLLCERTTFAPNVTVGVNNVKAEVAGTGYLVLQAAAYHQSVQEWVADQMDQLHKEEIETEKEIELAA